MGSKGEEADIHACRLNVLVLAKAAVVQESGAGMGEWGSATAFWPKGWPLP